MKRICVMGLGYVGLPTASILATNGFEVVGVDVSARVVDAVNSGHTHIGEPGLDTIVRAAVGSGNLRACLAPEKADVFFLAVPTPSNEDNTADMSYVRQAAEAIVPHLASGNLVIIESTSPPGTCRDLIKPIIEQSGMDVGKDVYLAHCPERVLSGAILKELIESDRVIGGYGNDCAARAEAIYRTFVEGDIFLTDVTTAEMVKVIENTFRDVNIALANETAVLCEDLGLNFSEVAQLANRHPRVNLHTAGPGVGGHCVAVDPWFLIECFPEKTQLIQCARHRNDNMPAHVVNGILELVAGTDNPKIGVLGLAFKGNVDDFRQSPSIAVIELLQDKGVQVAVHDPYVKKSSMELVSIEDCFRGADCVVLLTGHSDYKHLNPFQLRGLVRMPVLFDTRNLLEHDEWRKAGFQIKVLGSGRP